MITISTDKSKLQIETIHQFITESYWAIGRTKTEVEKTIEHSLCFGVYLNEKQIGFARIVSDYTVFTYLMDLFILPEYRGNGYSKQLMTYVINYPDLKGCKVWMLKTSDAQGLYKQFDYKAVKNPEKVMERLLT